MLKIIMRLIVALFIITGIIMVFASFFFHYAPVNLTSTEATDIFVGSTMIGVGTFIETRVR